MDSKIINSNIMITKSNQSDKINSLNLFPYLKLIELKYPEIYQNKERILFSTLTLGFTLLLVI